MEVYIDIITGFLESGKTTFIKEILNSKYIEEFHEIVLIICEEGFTEYDEEKLEEKHIKTLMLENEAELNDDLFQQIASEYNPEYILVEYNGTWNISNILRLKIPFDYKFRNVIFVSEAVNFRNQLSNMVTVMQPHILNSNVVIFNRFEKLHQGMKKKLIYDIKNINPRTRVTFMNELEPDKILKERFMSFMNLENTTLNLKMNLKVGIFFILCICLLLLLEIARAYSYTQSIVTVFLSILLQAIPFILLGAFISAGIQIFASTGWIMKQISKASWYSFLMAAVAGFFMPICDCGMVPIISGLLKKDTPLPQTITFWLSSSAVSPIVILSMIYAFPEQPYLAMVRVAAGLIVGIMLGVSLKLIHLETRNVIKGNRRFQNNIGKDVLELKYDGIKGKFEAVFAGAKIEFFRVAEYVVIGALISAVLQTVMPQTMESFIDNNNLILQFIVMIAAAMLMSACSTSNAFIGRSFSDNFSTVPILSFIVMGPMLDLKNMVMLSVILKKKFLLFLAALVVAESAIVFGALAIFM